MRIRDQRKRPKPSSRQTRLRLELLEARTVLTAAAGVYISEVQSNNRDTLLDADSDPSDWIDLYNHSPIGVDLAGWYLSDDPAALAKWQFPARTIQPNSHLLVFASGKNRAAATGELHTNFRLDDAGETVALVQPDGLTVAQQIRTSALAADESFGLPMSDFSLAAASTPPPSMLQGEVPITAIDVTDAATQTQSLGRTSNLTPAMSIDNNLATYGLPSVANNTQPILVGLDLNGAHEVDRLRVARQTLFNCNCSDVDGLNASYNDNVDLEILWTADTGPLRSRTYQPVSAMTNGSGGAELLNADAVNANGTISRDHHASTVNGQWWSVTFNPVNATALAVRVSRSSGEPSNRVFYPVAEYEAYRSVVETSPTGNIPIVAIDQFAGPGGIDRDANDAAAAIDGNLLTVANLTTAGTDRSHGPQRVAVDLGAATLLNRLRVFKNGDLDGVTELANWPDLTDLRILYTTDAGPLDQRTYLPVSQLTSGYNGAEPIKSTLVEYATGRVHEDRHDGLAEGYYSLTFAAVAATGLAIEFTSSELDLNGVNRYPIHALQVAYNSDAVLAPQPVSTPPAYNGAVSDLAVRTFERATPGGINRSGPRGPSVTDQADSIVKFNEIMYHPIADDAALEWIELHNQNAVDVDISGWWIEGGVYFEFPRGTVLPGGEYLVVAASPQQIAVTSGYATALGPMSGRLSNGTQRLALRTNNGRIMDTLDYGDNVPWPVGSDGSGASLAKRDPLSASGPAANWTASHEIGGTPGRANFFQQTDFPTTPVTITEIGTGDTDLVELQNLTDAAVDTSGWVVAVNNAVGGTVNSVNPNLWFLPTTLTAHGVVHRTDSPADNYWGSDILWDAGGKGWVMIVDDAGDVVDFLPWGYSVAELALLNVTINGHQIGGGGGGPNPFNPSSGVASGALSLWLDAQDAASITQAAGNRVSQWNDKSPLANHTRQTTTVMQPLYDATGIAGLPGIRFAADGTNDDVLITQSNSPFSGNSFAITTFAVAMLAQTPRTFSSIVSQTTSSDFRGMSCIVGGVIGGAAGTDHWNPGGKAATIPVGLNTPTTLSWVVPTWGTHQTATQIYYDGALQTTASYSLDNAASITLTANPLRIGNWLETRSDMVFPGWIGEVLVYQGALSNADRQAVEQYLASKWLASIPADVPWTGGGVVSSAAANQSLQRIRFADANRASDYSWQASTLGNVNAALVLPSPPPARLVINETAPATDAAFWLEIENDSDQPVDLAGYILRTSTGAQYVLPAAILAPGAFAVVSQANSGLDPLDTERVYLLEPGGARLLDARVVTNSLRG
ncbi:MAG: lamin tail domain-containing protein, partial [Pirellulales bacterium]